MHAQTIVQSYLNVMVTKMNTTNDANEMVLRAIE